MNIFKYVLAMTVAIAMSCGNTVQAQTKNDSNMKTVVVYFTHSGNTELAAKQVAHGGVALAEEVDILCRHGIPP